MRLRLTDDTRTALLIGLLAAILYAPAFWWGAPHATAPNRKNSWGVDDEPPLGPLAEIHNIIQPKPDRNLGYPLMYSFMAAAAYAPYLGYLRATGQWTDISGAYPFGFTDPVGTLKMLAYIAHGLTVLMGVGVVVFAFLAGSILWDRRTGLLAASFALLSYPMFYYTRTGNVDVPMLFFTALVFVLYALILKRGVTTGRAVGLGAAIGFALATKEPCFAFFLPMPFVLLYNHWRTRAPGQTLASRWFWKPAVLTVVAAFLALGAGSGLFVEPGRYLAHIEYTTSRMADYTEGRAHYGRIYDTSLAGYLAVAGEFLTFTIDSMTLPGVILVVIGLGVLVTRKDYLGLAVALSAVAYVVVLLASSRVMNLRYVLPEIFLLSFLAARAAAYGGSSPQRWVRWPLVLLAVSALGLGLLRGVDLTHAMLNDSRYAAAAWLAERTAPGDRIEFFGSNEKLPPLKAGVVSQQAVEYRGAIYKAEVGPEAVAAIKAGWATRRPAYIIIMPDHSSTAGMSYSHTCPPAIYEALQQGTIGYRRVAFFQTPALLPWVKRPALDYPSVNPPIQIFAASGARQGT